MPWVQTEAGLKWNGNTARPVERKEIKCKVCGGAGYQTGTKPMMYCSKSCQKKAARRRLRETTKN